MSKREIEPEIKIIGFIIAILLFGILSLYIASMVGFGL